MDCNMGRGHVGRGPMKRDRSSTMKFPFPQMKLPALLCCVALSPVVLAAQDQTDQNQADKMFVQKASVGSYDEVQLGQLAVQKASSDEVKQFAQKMIDDHTTLLTNMKPIADSMKIKPPMKMDKMDQAEYTKLNALSGDAFDKEYIAYMVKDHHKDLHEFLTEEKSTVDPKLKATVAQGETVIRQHTQMVDQMATSKGLPVPKEGKLPPEPPAPTM
jgi:putative membrane protein